MRPAFNFVGRRLSISLGRYATVIQAEIYAILPCACEIQLHGRWEKYVNNVYINRQDAQIPVNSFYFFVTCLSHLRKNTSHKNLCILSVYIHIAILCTVHTMSKYVRICCDSQAALKALQAGRTSPLVQQRQKTLNDISTRHTVGLYWVPGHARVQGNEMANKLPRDGSIQTFFGPELALGVSTQNIRKIRRWLVNQHWARYW